MQFSGNSEFRNMPQSGDFLPPRPSYRLSIRIRGFFHRVILVKIATWYMKYCRWRGISYPTDDNVDLGILPFNTVLKWSTKIREDEALSIAYAHSLGLPSPRLLSYGDEFNGEGGSIWMTRLPGQLLSEVWRVLSDAQKATIMSELDQCLLRLRQCRNPNSPRISSIKGSRIRSYRAPNGTIPPCRDKAALIDYLVSAGSSNINAADMQKIQRLAETSHSVVFTHGDLFRHNILVKDGHLSGIIDWECAGWLPEYWDYTTMTVRGSTSKSDWHLNIYSNPGFKYADELDAEAAIVLATQESWPRCEWFHLYFRRQGIHSILLVSSEIL